MRENDFDPIAGSYDLLQKLVLGNVLAEAQRKWLHLTDPGPTLILGGGTGRILKDIPRHAHPITYIDKSVVMLKKARKMDQRVTFLHIDFLEFRTDCRFQTIVCPFFLDVFGPDDLRRTIQRIEMLLLPRGRLLVSDFEPTSDPYYIFLIRLMHVFFRLTANLQASTLQPIHLELERFGFKLAQERFFKRKFIFSRLYQKRETFRT